ncbi:MAG: DUF3526 domain-containing protein, partial [Pseudomonadota bacterium]
QSTSMSAAGSDVRTHHRFLREAEAARFEFVQGLNKAHAEELSYTVDINRNTSEEAYEKSKISAANWGVLRDFAFTPDPAAARVARILPSLAVLILWVVFTALIGFTGVRRLPEVDHA